MNCVTKLADNVEVFHVFFERNEAVFPVVFNPKADNWKPGKKT
jgi:hypothetical protein